ncbi:MAG: hypothetical protein ABWX96_21340 [Propionibacteriaceae bacterium]
MNPEPSCEPVTLISTGRVRDLAPLALDDKGRLRVLPAEFWAQTTPIERYVFGQAHGIYGFPTTELVQHLKELIGDRKAIEIGAGNGVLADALGITGTDNHMQKRAKYRDSVLAQGSQPVRYGRNVVERDAHEAVRRYKPDVVIACWVTHRYDPRRHWAGGNEIGIDEADVINHCGEYIHIGNEKVHENKLIWVLPHTTTYPDFVYSRAINGTRDFIATWPGLKDAA